MWKDVEIFQDLPAKQYETTCNKMNLPVYLVHNVLDLWYARLRWFVGCIEVFFTRESHEEKLFLISGLSQKCPGEAEPITQRFLSEIVHHWEKLRDEWEANRPPLFAQTTEAAGNKKEDGKKRGKMSGESKSSASKNSGKSKESTGNKKTVPKPVSVSKPSQNTSQTNPGMLKSAQKSKKPETSNLSGKPQTKPETQKSIVIKPSETETPKNMPTPKSVGKLMTPQEFEKTKEAILKKTADKLKEIQKMSEKMLRQKEKKKKLEEESEKLKQTNEKLKQSLSEKEREMEELRQELADFYKNNSFLRSSASNSESKE